MSASFDPADSLPAWAFSFLDALKKTGIVSRAAERSGTTHSAVTNLRNRSAEFDDLFTQAMEYAIDGLESEAMRRAHEGTSEAVYYQGEVVGYKQNYSDGLLQFLLKGRRREVFGDKQEITGADGAPLQIDTTTRAARVSQLMLLATQRLALTGDTQEPAPITASISTDDDTDPEELV